MSIRTLRLTLNGFSRKKCRKANLSMLFYPVNFLFPQRISLSRANSLTKLSILNFLQISLTTSELWQIQTVCPISITLETLTLKVTKTLFLKFPKMKSRQNINFRRIRFITYRIHAIILHLGLLIGTKSTRKKFKKSTRCNCPKKLCMKISKFFR